MKKLIPIVALMMAMNAKAGVFDVNLNINTNFLAICFISSTDMSFGQINSNNTTAVTANSKVTTICNRGVQYVLTSSRGFGADYNNRAMKGATGNNDKLMYNLYRDSSMIEVWGDSNTGISRTATGLFQDTVIYGKVPANQYIKAGNYSDTITVTISY